MQAVASTMTCVPGDFSPITCSVPNMLPIWVFLLAALSIALFMSTSYLVQTKSHFLYFHVTNTFEIENRWNITCVYQTPDFVVARASCEPDREVRVKVSVVAKYNIFHSLT